MTPWDPHEERHRRGPPWARHDGHPRRGPPWARHKGSPLWSLARGIHGTVAQFGFVALVIGMALGVALHWGRVTGWGLLPLFCAGLTAVWLVGAVGWGVTWKIVGPLRRVALVASDLSEGRLDRREALAEEPGEVGEVAQALRGISDRLAQQLKDQRALLAAVSHELRSPLGRARVVAELLRDGTDPGLAADRLDREIDAMDGLIADLLAAARINFEAVSPQDLDGVDLARRAIEIGGAPVEIVGGDAPVPVRADPTLLARALSGILDNARRYGAKRVELRILSVGDVLRYEIADDGPGFGEGDEERAFQPFWRAPSSPDRPDPGGTGLGLALVRQIAQAHGGAAGARNRDGGGAVVWIELPRAG